MKTVATRAHRNGRGAEVRRQDDGLFYACCSPTEAEGTPSVGWRENITTLARAQALADSYAHPGCDGTCAGWTETR